jgi:hypothetical protein
MCPPLRCDKDRKRVPSNVNDLRNGRWRSQWAVVLTEKQAELKGTIKVQVHYYEDGNVQLVSSKDVERKITVSVSLSPAFLLFQIINNLSYLANCFLTQLKSFILDSVLCDTFIH